MGKLHYYDYETLDKAPAHVKADYKKQGLDGAICGYVRKTTRDKEKVTCFYCLRKMKQVNVL